MTRMTELKDAIFDVDTRPLFVKSGDRELPVRDSLAIVDVTTGRVVSVVGRSYRLVSHKEALNLAFDCAAAAFPGMKTDQWQVVLVDAPSTGGTCFIDLAHNSALLDFTGVAAANKPEVYGPFVRVTNSYNRTRALSFDIGYYRKVCKNGLILRDSLIRFKMSHQRREIGETIKFEISQDKLKEQQQEFMAFLTKLQACEVPEKWITRFACDVLGFRPPTVPEDKKESRWAAWRALVATVSATRDRYVKDLGENANYVLNVVTDIASQPPENLEVRRDRNSLQRRAGKWASDFSQVCDGKDFDLQSYLDSLRAAGPAIDKIGRGAVAA